MQPRFPDITTEVTLTFDRAYTPSDFAVMAEEALQWVNTLADPENPWGSPPEPAGEAATEEEEPAETNEKRRSFTVADLVAGDIPTVPVGQALKQVNTPSAPANNIEFIRLALPRHFCLPAGV